MAASRVFDITHLQQFTAINVLSDPGHIGGPVVLGNAVRVMPLWQLPDGKLARNVVGGIKGSFTVASSAVAEAIRAAWIANANWAPMIARMAPSVSFVGIEIQDLQQAGNPIFRSTGTAIAGTSAGIALPDEVALVLTLRTARVGRQWRGRLYQPGWTSTDLGSGGVAATAAINALTGYAGCVIAGLAAGGLTWGLIKPARQAYTSPTTGVSYPARAASIEPIVTTTVRDNHWDTQRRRGLK